MKYESVIGIETHVQLATASKLFCACDNDSRMATPNQNICPVCLAEPGTLPVLNQRAVELAVRAGLALGAEVATLTKFDRKNYFYPDNPKGYQITQYDEPIVGRGEIEVPLGEESFRVGIIRAHLEEDAGKLTHPVGADYSLVDLNRAGTPLLEIVSAPDMRSAEQAKAYAKELYNIMRHAGVSDADLFHGHMRFDVNVSVRPEGSNELGTRTETKNLNSFKAVERAIQFETRRQIEVLESGGTVVQETRGWDEDKGVTFSQRTKEESHDYRYFPEPDLPPLVITKDMIVAQQQSLVSVKDLRLELGASLDHQLTEQLIASDQVWLVELFRAFLAVKGGEDRKDGYASRVGFWLLEHSTWFKRENIDTDAKALHLLSLAVDAGRLSSTAAKSLLVRALKENWGEQELASQIKATEQISDEGSISEAVAKVIKDNPDSVADYQAGKERALTYLVGQVMKHTKGQANPGMVNELLLKKLKR